MTECTFFNTSFEEEFFFFKRARRALMLCCMWKPKTLLAPTNKRETFPSDPWWIKTLFFHGHLACALSKLNKPVLRPTSQCESFSSGYYLRKLEKNRVSNWERFTGEGPMPNENMFSLLIWLVGSCKPDLWT